MKRMMAFLLALSMLTMSGSALAATTNAETGESVSVGGGSLKVYDTTVYEEPAEMHGVKKGDKAVEAVVKAAEQVAAAVESGEYTAAKVAVSEAIIPAEKKEAFESFPLTKQLVAVMRILGVDESELSDDAFLSSVNLTADDLTDVLDMPVADPNAGTVNSTECSWIKYEVDGEEVDAIMIVLEVVLPSGVVNYQRFICVKNADGVWEIQSMSASVQ